MRCHKDRLGLTTISSLVEELDVRLALEDLHRLGVFTQLNEVLDYTLKV